MRVRIHRHITDLAGSGLVLVGFLLVAMIVSAVPALVQSMSGRHSSPPPSPALSAPSGHASAMS